MQNSNVGSSLALVEFKGLMFYIAVAAAQHEIGFCWQNQLGAVLHCLALHHAHNSCHPSHVIIWLQGMDS